MAGRLMESDCKSHFNNQFTGPVRMLEILDRFAKLGPSIKVTEFDVDVADETLQATFMRDFLTAMFSHPSVNGVFVWGFSQARPNGAMFKSDWSRKPNAEADYDLVFRQWWTNADGATDGDGLWNLRAIMNWK